MLIANKLNAIIRILLVNSLENKQDLTVYALAKKAGITQAMAKRLVIRLKDSEYVSIGHGVRVVNPIKLIRAWGYTYSVNELDNIQFVAAERPQYVMLKIANMARMSDKRYAFTLFSATEHINPYVAPSVTHLYIPKKDAHDWEFLFTTANMLPTEKGGDVICFLVDEYYFEGTWNSRGMMVTSVAQLCADLYSYGGRGEEAAEQLITMIKRRLENV
ncbi:MAG: hypothetical protein HY051_01675 [Candidatus Aenigmarchaeota archaeon]|nr:hypothetical protein [Candidatus Aenigmarchaeota archaeon]